MWAKLMSLVLCGLSCQLWALDDNSRVAFYYGDTLPASELHAFQVVVVSPNPTINPKSYNNAASELYAYISVGEVDKDSPQDKEIAASWRKGSNSEWKSSVMDMSNPAWRAYLLNHVLTPLWQKGYRGFFFDTMDSYQGLHLNATDVALQKAGLIDFVKSVKTLYPEAHIITNRGFELLPETHALIDAIAAESLFSSWNNQTKSYVPVTESDKNWLFNALTTVKKKYHLPVIVIDYLARDKRAEAKVIAQKIQGLGFIPWVTDGDLTTLGVGTIEVQPRKLLFLFNDKKYGQGISAYNSMAFVLQYLGYIPIVHNVDESMPAEHLTDEYAGVITWFNTPVIKQHAAFEKWLNTQLDAKMPLVFLDFFGIAPKAAILKRLGIEMHNTGNDLKQVTCLYHDPMIRYDLTPTPVASDFQAVQVGPEGKVLLKFGSTNQQTEDAVVLMPWGGYALAPFNQEVMPNGEQLWIINPFIFLEKALRLTPRPVPDITTENGRRILTAHVDGDAFISLVPWREDQYAGEVLYDEILTKYDLPITISIIQRELELLAPDELLAFRMIRAARAMYALPKVEIATHTYSHPLQWHKLVEGQPNIKFVSYPDKDYLFNYKKEMAGSSDFINAWLAPADSNKRVKLVFWSGDAVLQEGALIAAEEAGLLNINGMGDVYTKQKKTVSNLAPFGAYVGKHYQVYSPIPNDFVYTEDWIPPTYAFDKVIHSFELTEKPVRLKPMSIYYHFYSATDQAALRALKRIYNWVSKQPSTPLQISDYVHKVLGFNSTVLAKTLNGEWLITNHGALREFRLAKPLGFPDLQHSKEVLGFSEVNDDRYIHLSSKPEALLSLATNPPTGPYLQEANAMIERWDVSEDSIGFAFKGYVPLQFKIANMESCTLALNGKKGLKTEKDGFYRTGETYGTFEIRCGNR